MRELAPAHQHYPRDFCVETLNMTPEACGIYVWLRGACWMDGSITANISDLARACKTNPKAMARAWSQMAHLFEKQGDRLIHPGMETIRKQQEIYREKKSHAGKVGAGSRWQSHNSRITDAGHKHATSITNYSSASASASASAIEEEKNSPPSPLTQSNLYEPTEPPDPPPEGRTEYPHDTVPWESFVETVAKAMHERHPKVRSCGMGEITDRLRTIARTVKPAERRELLLQINSTHAEWCLTDQWTKEGGEYAKGLDNWLAPTRGRWKNHPPEANRNHSHGSKSKIGEAMDIFEERYGHLIP